VIRPGGPPIGDQFALIMTDQTDDGLFPGAVGFLAEFSHSIGSTHACHASHGQEQAHRTEHSFDAAPKP
jgi:hypothetical protein